MTKPNTYQQTLQDTHFLCEQWLTRSEALRESTDMLEMGLGSRQAFDAGPSGGRAMMRVLLEAALEQATPVCTMVNKEMPADFAKRLQTLETKPIQNDTATYTSRRRTDRQVTIDAVFADLKATSEQLGKDMSARNFLAAYAADFGGLSSMSFDLKIFKKHLPDTTNILRALAAASALEGFARELDSDAGDAKIQSSAQRLYDRFKGQDYNPKIVNLLELIASELTPPDTLQDAKDEASAFFAQFSQRIINGFDTTKLAAAYRKDMEAIPATLHAHIVKDAPALTLKLSKLDASITLKSLANIVDTNEHSIDRMYPPRIERGTPD